MRFKLWLETLLSTSQMHRISQYGYSYVDEFSIGNMEMFLLKDDVGLYPEKFKYHLAVQKTGLDVFDKEQQHTRPKGNPTNLVDSVKHLEPILNKITEWIGTYGKLVIASTNPDLTNKWFNNLVVGSRYFNIPINIETHRFYGHVFHLIGTS